MAIMLLIGVITSRESERGAPLVAEKQVMSAPPEERLQKMHPKSMDDGLTKAYALYWASEPWRKTC